MHDFYASQDNACAAKVVEAHHRPDNAFDGTMILFDDVVQILDLPDLDRRFPFSVDGLQDRQIGPAFIRERTLMWLRPISGASAERTPDWSH
jgi:hypothetical protein